MKKDKIIHIDVTHFLLPQSCCVCEKILTCKYYIKSTELVNLLLNDGISLENASKKLMIDTKFIEVLSEICNNFNKKKGGTVKAVKEVLKPNEKIIKDQGEFVEIDIRKGTDKTGKKPFHTDIPSPNEINILSPFKIVKHPDESDDDYKKRIMKITDEIDLNPSCCTKPELCENQTGCKICSYNIENQKIKEKEYFENQRTGNPAFIQMSIKDFLKRPDVKVIINSENIMLQSKCEYCGKEF